MAIYSKSHYRFQNIYYRNNCYFNSQLININTKAILHNVNSSCSEKCFLRNYTNRCKQ